MELYSMWRSRTSWGSSRISHGDPRSPSGPVQLQSWLPRYAVALESAVSCFAPLIILTVFYSICFSFRCLSLCCCPPRPCLQLCPSRRLVSPGQTSQPLQSLFVGIKTPVGKSRSAPTRSCINHEGITRESERKLASLGPHTPWPTWSPLRHIYSKWWLSIAWGRVGPAGPWRSPLEN